MLGVRRGLRFDGERCDVNPGWTGNREGHLQCKGTSHPQLFLYRENGKLSRRLSYDNSGLLLSPTSGSDGETIVLFPQING